jgi:hypothetical protein
MLHRWAFTAQPRNSLNNQQKSANYGVMTASEFYISLVGFSWPLAVGRNPDSRTAYDGTWFHAGYIRARNAAAGQA